MSTPEDYCKSNSKKVGPELPPNFGKRQLSDLETSDNRPTKSSKYLRELSIIPSESYGPTLSPHLTNKRRDICGPQLPSNFKLSGLEASDNIPLKSPRHLEELSVNTISEEKSESYGPALPPHLIKAKKEDAGDSKLPTAEFAESSEDDECYGPVLPDMVSHSKAHIALEERALQMKIDSLQGDVKDQVTREQWMIDLPEVHTRNLGLGPRQFRAKPAPDLSDRSSWTDTPKDKDKKTQGKHPKKIDLKKETEIKEQKKYDKEQEKIIKEYKKLKKEESLLDIHQRNLSKKKKEEGCTRRPFNREIDLKVNHFDEAQKKAILKKAQLLDDRFSSGHSKFL